MNSQKEIFTPLFQLKPVLTKGVQYIGIDRIIHPANRARGDSA